MIRSAPDQKTRAPTIAFFVETASAMSSYQAALLRGVADVVRQAEFRFLCVAGGALERAPGNRFEHMRNVVYDLVIPYEIDGLVINGSIGTFLKSDEDFRVFSERYKPTRIVTTLVSLPGIPSVRIDNNKGMGDLVRHLVSSHKYRRIAFIKGPDHNSDAVERFQAYESILAENGLPIDSALVVPGDFLTTSGVDAVRVLLDERRVAVDAIVAANDDMALGALKELRRRCCRVPEDIAVAGFDDVEEARVTTPSLTTVRHTPYRQGRHVAKLLLALLAGEDSCHEEMLAPELIIRRSCGCHHEPDVDADGSFLLASTEQTEDHIRSTKDAVVRAVSSSSLPSATTFANHLVDDFLGDVEGRPEAFLPAIQIVIRESLSAGADVLCWEEALFVLRQGLRSMLREDQLQRAELLWQAAQIRLCRAAQEVHAYRQLQAEQRAEALTEVSHALVSAQTAEDLADTLEAKLPKLGIPSCMLATYEDPAKPLDWARMLMAYGPQGRVARDRGKELFPARRLVPDWFEPGSLSRCSVLEPLYFQGTHLGFVIFGVEGDAWPVCETLQAQLSGALWVSALLRRETVLRRSLEEKSSSLQLEQVAESILDKVGQLAPYKNASLQLVRDGTRTLLAGRGFDVHKAISSFPSDIARDPIIHRIVEMRWPLIISKTSENREWTDSGGAKCVQSWVGVPLFYAQELIGILTLDHDQPGQYSKDLEQGLASFAHAAATELRKAYLFNRAEERIRHLEVITDASKRMTGELRTHHLLSILADVVVERLDCRRCVVFLPDLLPDTTDRGGFTPAVVRGEKTSDDELHPVMMADWPLGWVFLHGKSILVKDASLDERFAPASRTDDLPRSMLAVPLKSASGVVAVIYADQAMKGWFDESKLGLVEALAVQATIATERNLGLDRLQTTASLVTGLADMNRLLKAVLETAVRVTHTTTGVIHLINTTTMSVEESVCHRDSDHPAPRLTDEAGLTRQLLRGMDVIRIKDAHTDPRVNESLRDLYGAMLGVLLRIGQKPIGALFLNDVATRDFTDVEVSIVSTLAAQAAIAIENARLIRDGKEQVEHLTSTTQAQTQLIDLMSAAPLSESIEERLVRFSVTIEKWSGVESVGVLQPNENGEYDIDGLKLDGPQRSALESIDLGTQHLRLDIPNAILIPAILDQSPSMFLVVRLSGPAGERVRPWLQITTLILQYLNQIATLIREAERLRAANEHQQSMVLAGMLTRAYNHEALNGVKAIQAWIHGARTGVVNIDILEDRVKTLFDNIVAIKKTKDFLSVTPRPCTFNDVFYDVLNSLAFRNGRKLEGCELRLDVKGHRHRRTSIDAATLGTIINNLVLNAQEQYKFGNSSKKGPIEIAIKEKDFGGRPFVGFEVKDYAVGIAEEHRSRVFESGWTTKPGGQGYGLWIVKNLVEACQGKVTLDSVPGYTTTFGVFYPIEGG